MSFRTIRYFLTFQFILFILLFTIFDCIIRGPMEQIEKQLDNILWIQRAGSRRGIEEIGQRLNGIQLEIFDIKRYLMIDQ